MRTGDTVRTSDLRCVDKSGPFPRPCGGAWESGGTLDLPDGTTAWRRDWRVERCLHLDFVQATPIAASACRTRQIEFLLRPIVVRNQFTR